MLYHLGRNGVTYGPYPLPELQRMLAQRQVLPTDICWTPGMAGWLPVFQVLRPAPVFAASDPPSLHWGLVLLISIFTSGAFSTAWIIVQAHFVRQIDPASKAMRLLLINLLVAPVAIVLVLLAGAAAKLFGPAAGILFLVLLLLTALCSIALYFSAVFSLRRSLLAYYNTVENCGLRLGPVMAFFFNTFYFQYHFTRIANWKRTGILA